MTDKMYGVVNGAYICNIDRDAELSERLAARNVPDGNLPPQFSMRPASTKYSILPIVDPRTKAALTPLKPVNDFSVDRMFNPGNSQAPWSGFANSIDNESKLRNQFMALQKSDQAYYIPPTTSDMYTSTSNHVNPSPEQSKLMFSQEAFQTNMDKRCPFVDEANTDFFNNSTRPKCVLKTGKR